MGNRYRNRRRRNAKNQPKFDRRKENIRLKNEKCLRKFIRQHIIGIGVENTNGLPELWNIVGKYVGTDLAGFTPDAIIQHELFDCINDQNWHQLNFQVGARFPWTAHLTDYHALKCCTKYHQYECPCFQDSLTALCEEKPQHEFMQYLRHINQRESEVGQSYELNSLIMLQLLKNPHFSAEDMRYVCERYDITSGFISPILRAVLCQERQEEVIKIVQDKMLGHFHFFNVHLTLSAIFDDPSQELTPQQQRFKQWFEQTYLPALERHRDRENTFTSLIALGAADCYLTSVFDFPFRYENDSV